MYKLLIILILVAANSYDSTAVAAQTINKTDTVVICKSKNAHAYHRYECKGLKHCSYTLVKMSREQAVNMGYHPCKMCYR